METNRVGYPLKGRESESEDEVRERGRNTGKIRVLVADEQALFRSGLKVLLAGTDDIAVTAEAETGEEAIELVSANDIDVVLLETALPDQSGLDVLRRIKEERPGLPVLILTEQPEEKFAVRALRGGASGYITKKKAAHELLGAIRKVVEGGKHISLALGERLAAELYGGAAKLPHETLSEREYQVMCMIASGKAMGEVAESLQISINTVNSYRSRILNKLNLKNTADIIRYAVKNSLVS